MSTNPTSFRYPVAIEGKAEPEVIEMLNYHDDSIQDLQQAIPILKGKIDALTPGSASSAASTPSAAATVQSSETVIIEETSPATGFVNNQAGNTAYTTQQSDAGALIVLNSASPIAVTLSTAGTSPAIQVPWQTSFTNQGTGTATLTPATGFVFSAVVPSGAVSYTLAPGAIVSIYFDGANFFI